MGLLPPVILGALLIVAFALTSLQRLAIASHSGPMPARQIAYQMRTHHQGAIALKQADPSLETVIDAPPPTMSVGDFRFLSCISGQSVSTAAMEVGDAATLIPEVSIPSTEIDAVLEELARQSVMSPELGRLGAMGWSTGSGGVRSAAITPIAGIGITAGAQIRTAFGLIPLTANCPIPDGAPIIVTQVVP